MDEKIIDKIIKDEVKKEEIILPANIELKLEDTYELIKNMKVEQKLKKTNFAKKATIAAAISICMVGIISFTPALAEKIPGLREVSKYLKGEHFYNDNMEKYADNINITKSLNGIEVTLEGVIYDQSSLKFIYTLTSKEKLQWGVQLRDTTLKINGKNIITNKNNGEFNIDDVKIEDTADDGEKYAVVNSYDVSKLDLDSNVDIQWQLSEIHLENQKYSKGPWTFNFKTSKERLMENTKIVNVNHEYNVEGYKYTIDKIIITPVEIKLLSTVDRSFYKDQYEVKDSIIKKIKVKNESGCYSESDLEEGIKNLEDNEENKRLRERYYSLNNIDKKIHSLHAAIITDEKGNKLKHVMGRGSNGKNTDIFKPLNEMPKKLIFTPTKIGVNRSAYDTHIGERVEISINDLKPGKEFMQGKNMPVIINSVEKKENNLKVNVTYNGDFKEARKYLSDIILVPSDIKIDKNKDKDYYSNILSKININKNKYDENSVEYYFQLEEGKDYKVLLTKILEDELKKEDQLIVDVN